VTFIFGELVYDTVIYFTIQRNMFLQQKDIYLGTIAYPKQKSLQQFNVKLVE